MVQDSELPKYHNLSTETNTNLDGKENDNILQADSNKTDTITANDQNINANNEDTYIKNSNETQIDEYETVQDSSHPNPINDSINTSFTHNNKESADNGLSDSDEAKEDTNNDSDANDLNHPDNDPAGNDPAEDDPAEDDPAIGSQKENKI